MGNKILFSGRIYYQAYSEEWLESLAVYILLCKTHTGRSFYYKPKHKTKMLRKLALKTGIGYTTLYRHLRVLVVKGLVAFHKHGEMKLMSNRLIKFNKHKTLYVGREFNSFKDIKFILKNIPFLSCLKRQQRFILKREHYALINQGEE